MQEPHAEPDQTMLMGLALGLYQKSAHRPAANSRSKQASPRASAAKKHAWGSQVAAAGNSGEPCLKVKCEKLDAPSSNISVPWDSVVVEDEEECFAKHIKVLCQEQIRKYPSSSLAQSSKLVAEKRMKAAVAAKGRSEPGTCTKNGRKRPATAVRMNVFGALLQHSQGMHSSASNNIKPFYAIHINRSRTIQQNLAENVHTAEQLLSCYCFEQNQYPSLVHYSGLALKAAFDSSAHLGFPNRFRTAVSCDLLTRICAVHARYESFFCGVLLPKLFQGIYSKQQQQQQQQQQEQQQQKKSHAGSTGCSVTVTAAAECVLLCEQHVLRRDRQTDCLLAENRKERLCVSCDSKF